MNLLWLGCGIQDDFYTTNKAAHQELEKAGIKQVWVGSEGGHEWLVWRRYLRDFALLLFRQ